MQKQDICPAVLEKLYTTKKMSCKEIAILFQKQGMSIKPWTVSRRVKELKIVRSMSDAILVKDFQRPSIQLSEIEMEALDGFLLGDGSIQQQSSRTGRLALTVQYEEFGKYLLSHFERYNPKWRQRYIDSERYQKVLSQWSGETKSDKCFLNQRKRWYPQGKKIVPHNVRLTPLSLLLWYLGDGSYRPSDGCIFLNTQGFATEDVEFLCSKLNGLGVNCHRDKRNKVYIGARYAILFLKLLAPNPVICYNYKFIAIKEG